MKMCLSFTFLLIYCACGEPFSKYRKLNLRTPCLFLQLSGIPDFSRFLLCRHFRQKE